MGGLILLVFVAIIAYAIITLFKVIFTPSQKVIIQQPLQQQSQETPKSTDEELLRAKALVELLDTNKELATSMTKAQIEAYVQAYIEKETKNIHKPE